MTQPPNTKNDLHWICGNLPIDGKSKLNLGKFYKRDKNLTEYDREDVRWCCANETSGLIPFETKGPYIYNLYTPLEQEPKCWAVDLFFEQPVTIVRIRFQNYYVAYLSLLAKMVGHRDWEVIIQHKELMPSPHFETGSRSYFELKPPPPAKEWTEITELRFVLRQPSPCWKKSYLENISVYREHNAVASGGTYLTNLIQKTTEALKMERRINDQQMTSGNNIPFHIGTCGYEIDKLPQF